jgi:hypothetical protein
MGGSHPTSRNGARRWCDMDGSHCVALSRPKALADRLEACRAEL